MRVVYKLLYRRTTYFGPAALCGFAGIVAGGHEVVEHDNVYGVAYPLAAWGAGLLWPVTIPLLTAYHIGRLHERQ